MIDYARIRRFLVEAFDPGKKAQCYAIQLRTVPRIHTPEVLKTWPVRSGPGEKLLVAVDDCAKEIALLAQGDANGRGGKHKYSLVPFFGEGETNPGGRLFIRAEGNSDDEGDDDDDEEGYSDAARSFPRESRNEPGNMYSETMRQAIAVYRQRSANIENDIRSQSNTNAALRKSLAEKEALISSMLAARVQTTILVETTRTQAHARHLEAEHQGVISEGIRTLISQGKNVIPTVVNYIAGGPLMPVGTSHPVFESIATIFQTIKPEQAMAMGSIFNEKQREVFGKTIELVVADQARVDAEKQARMEKEKAGAGLPAPNVAPSLVEAYAPKAPALPVGEKASTT
jgi:hypothetical protein